MTDPRFDRDGNRVENPTPGNPNPDSNAPGEAELASIRRAKSYAWHNAGTREVWYDQNDAGNMPPRKRGGRGGR